MRVLLWHVHGSWTDAFVRGRHHYLLPTLPGGGSWGLGRAGRDWPDTVEDIDLATLDPGSVDAVVLQRPDEIGEVARLLRREPGRDLPAVYVEHNTPKGNVPSTVHPLAGQSAIRLIHVTHFNALIWDNGSAPVTVIEHGVNDPGYRYTGELPELAVVVNEPVRRGRVTGTDLLPRFADAAPLQVFGMGGAELPGATGLAPARLRVRGDLPSAELHRQMPLCRAYIHPLRWTSLGLALLEAMHLGMPVLALATTEASRAVPPDAGAVSASVDELVSCARRLLRHPDEARQRGLAARHAALARYGLQRFLDDWDAILGDLPTRPGASRLAVQQVPERSTT